MSTKPWTQARKPRVQLPVEPTSGHPAWDTKWSTEAMQDYVAECERKGITGCTLNERKVLYVVILSLHMRGLPVYAEIDEVLR